MTRRTALIWVAVCALLLALYALAGFVLLPYGIERYATRYVAEQLGAELTLGDTDFNPFLLRFEAEGLRLSKPGKLPNSQEPPPPMLALERLVVDLDWSSLWHSPWTVSEFGLYGVRWHGQIGPDGRLDWAALTNDTGGGEAGSPPQWQVEHVVVRDGRLTLVDLRGATPASAVLGNVEISARDLATFQREGGPRGHYQLSAAFATGGTLRGQGSLTLTPALHSRGQWALADVKLPAIWPLLSSAIGLDLDPVAATLSASSNYVYSTSDAKSASRSVAATSGPIFELDALALRLDDVALRASESERALLRLKTLSADGGR
ncbi:MAG TPA: DUF748 domain-containing protein, partial [Burkholderiaceae bacterium]|nr:DUF748 domain-containing protein [Burkholderiaceae bacterium]